MEEECKLLKGGLLSDKRKKIEALRLHLSLVVRQKQAHRLEIMNILKGEMIIVHDYATFTVQEGQDLQDYVLVLYQRGEDGIVRHTYLDVFPEKKSKVIYGISFDSHRRRTGVLVRVCLTSCFCAVFLTA